ncbi:hypothetical protein LZ32DRAFT_611952 [Colletotrichum eremochloae]|nr:hypothetical protein LZ32DRAFT_611952 [Colletotrichum eremochloae]
MSRLQRLTSMSEHSLVASASTCASICTCICIRCSHPDPGATSSSPSISSCGP